MQEVRLRIKIIRMFFQGYTESDDDELESLLELSSESDVGETTTTASSADSDDEEEKPSPPRRSSRRSLRSNKDERLVSSTCTLK